MVGKGLPDAIHNSQPSTLTMCIPPNQQSSRLTFAAHVFRTGLKD